MGAGPWVAKQQGAGATNRRKMNAMTSSVRFPSVALSRPPTASPVVGPQIRWHDSERGQRDDGQDREQEGSGALGA